MLFFLWQAACSALETTIARSLLLRALHGAPRGKFDRQLLKDSWRFAAGMTIISVLSLILTQLDKILLSWLLPLAEFGVYTLAWRIASVIYYLVSPFTAAYFPLFSQLAGAEKESDLRSAYHFSCQLVFRFRPAGCQYRMPVCHGADLALDRQPCARNRDRANPSTSDYRDDAGTSCSVCRSRFSSRMGDSLGGDCRDDRRFPACTLHIRSVEQVRGGWRSTGVGDFETPDM
jgi:hypothetical protein